MSRHFFLFLLIFGLNITVCLSSKAQEVSPQSVSGEQAYTVYRQITTSDYLPEEKSFIVADYTRPRVRKIARSRAEMNIPMSFAAVGMLTLLIVFIFVIGLMLHDMSREDPVEVGEIAGPLND